MAAMDVWLSVWVASADSVSNGAKSDTDINGASYGSGIPSSWLNLPRNTYIGVFVGTTALYMVLGLAGSLMYAIGGFRYATLTSFRSISNAVLSSMPPHAVRRLIKTRPCFSGADRCLKFNASSIHVCRASKVIHYSSMHRMLYAPYSWFQETPVGRIMSRFTTDLSFVDLQLSSWLDSLTQLGFQFIAMVAVVIWILPQAAVPVVLATCVYVFASTAVNRTNREIKREANQAMGPVQSNVAESVRASLIARVMRCEAFFTKRHHVCADSFNRANFITHGDFFLNSFRFV